MIFHNITKVTDSGDFIIPIFTNTGGKSNNPYYMIYCILNRLRENFNIKQRVQLLEEKLRKFFAYWLDITSRKLNKTVNYDGNVILLYDQIDLMEEQESGKESIAKFWLPGKFPSRVNCIVSCQTDSKNYQYFKRIGCRILHINLGEDVLQGY